MQRLHKGLAQHFQQDAGLPIRLFVEGYGTILTIDSKGSITSPFKGELFPKELKELFLDNALATTEELLHWLEKHTSILIRVNNEKQIFN